MRIFAEAAGRCRPGICLSGSRRSRLALAVDETRRTHKGGPAINQAGSVTDGDSDDMANCAAIYAVFKHSFPWSSL